MPLSSFADCLALSPSLACRLGSPKLLPANGDGEIRTLDPLLARQVLSQLSYAPIWVTYLIIQSHSASGLEKTRTSDLTLIRRAL